MKMNKALALTVVGIISVTGFGCAGKSVNDDANRKVASSWDDNNWDHGGWDNGRDHGRDHRGDHDRDHGGRRDWKFEIVFSVTQREEGLARQEAYKVCEEEGHGRLENYGTRSIDFGKKNGVIATYKCTISERDRDNYNNVPIVVTTRDQESSDRVARNVCHQAIWDHRGEGRNRREDRGDFVRILDWHDGVAFGHNRTGVATLAYCRLAEDDNDVPLAVTARTQDEAWNIINDNCSAIRGRFDQKGSEDVDFGKRNGVTIYGLCHTRN